MTDFWEPLFDLEWEVLHRAMPELKAERREGVWWVRVTANVTTEEEARKLLRLVIAEELAGEGLNDASQALHRKFGRGNGI